MKKNIGLLLILSLLLIITYVSQEKKSITKKKNEENYSKILDSSMYGELVELQTPFSHIKRIGESFVNFSDGHGVDQNRVNEFLSRLSDIRAIKYLEKVSPSDMKNFFEEDHLKMTFTFENETLEYQLGKKINFSQDFYIAFKTKAKGQVIALATDKMPYEGVISKEEEHRSDHKYQRVKSLFSLPPNFFLDLNIFDEEELERSIVFSNISNESFSIDFSTASTNPPPLFPIDVSKERMGHLRSKLLGLRALSYLRSPSVSKFSRQVGSIKTEKGLYPIYERYNNDQFYYILNPKNNIYYQFKAGEQKLLLFSVQSLWNLRVVDELGENISITFSSGEKLDLELYKLGEEASRIYNILLTPAEYITDNVNLEQYKKWQVKLNVNTRELEVYLSNSEMIILDRSLKVTYHYLNYYKNKISIDPKSYRVK